MREYELRLRFTAADGNQASRLAEAWAGTCAAEYGTRYAGWREVGSETSTHPPDLPAVPCEWCGRAIRQVDGAWLAVKGSERGYEPDDCDANPHYTWHSPSASGT